MRAHPNGLTLTCYFLRDFVFKQYQILKYWRLGLQHTNFRRDTIPPSKLSQTGFPGQQTLRWSLAYTMFIKVCAGDHVWGRERKKTGSGRGMYQVVMQVQGLPQLTPQGALEQQWSFRVAPSCPRCPGLYTTTPVGPQTCPP